MDLSKAINHERLSNYLNEHLLASEAGFAAFTAATKTWQDTEEGEALESLRLQIKADHEDLKALILELGYTESLFKRVLTVIARPLGRINPVNVLRVRRISLAQIELDVLTGMVNAKLSMWDTLVLLTAHEPKLPRPLLDDLRDRAISQIEQLLEINRSSFGDRFFK